MSEENTPAVERTPAEELKPTENYKVLAAAMETIAKSADTLSEKAEHLATVQAEMTAERGKMRAVQTADVGGMAFKDAMTRPTTDARIKDLHELNDRAIDRAVVRLCKDRAVPAGTEIDLRHVPKAMWDDIDEVKEIRTKAAGTFWDAGTTATSIADWAPTMVLATAVDYPTIDSDLPSLFDNITIPLGVRTVRVPVDTAQAYAFLEDEQTTHTTPADNVVNTGVVRNAVGGYCDLTAKKIANIAAMSVEATEDVAVSLIARGRTNSSRAVVHGINQAMLNGSTATDATLDDAPAVSGYFAADGFSNSDGDSGLRLQAINTSWDTAIGGAVDSDDLLAARKAMGKFGARPTDLAYITSPLGYLGMLADDDVKTVDKYGMQATVLTGELAKSGGIPIFMDSEFSEDLDAAGINANAGTTGITGGILVNRTRWLFGTGRTLSQTIVPQPGFDVVWVVTRARVDFQIMITDEHNLQYLINVT